MSPDLGGTRKRDKGIRDVGFRPLAPTERSRERARSTHADGKWVVMDTCAVAGERPVSSSPAALIRRGVAENAGHTSAMRAALFWTLAAASLASVAAQSTRALSFQVSTERARRVARWATEAR